MILYICKEEERKPRKGGKEMNYLDIENMADDWEDFQTALREIAERRGRGVTALSFFK